MYFRPKSFRTIFERRTPVYSFAAPLLGLAKSIYYIDLANSKSRAPHFFRWYLLISENTLIEALNMPQAKFLLIGCKYSRAALI